MKRFWLASCLLLPFAAPSAASSHDKGVAEAPVLRAGDGGDDGCPAAALIERWEQARAALAALPEARRAAVEDAQATLSKSCPVCQEAPGSFAFLGSFLDATVALDERVLATVEESERSGACADTPAEIRAAFAERIAIAARTRELYAAFAGAMAPPQGSNGDGSGSGEPSSATTADVAPPTLVEVAASFREDSQEAVTLTADWNGVPARAQELAPGTKADLLAAMEILRSLPTCELADETMALIADGFGRLVALDRTLAEHCAKVSATQKEVPPQLAQLRAAAEARAGATVRVLALLVAMKRTMTPEIFDSRSAIAAGAGR